MTNIFHRDMEQKWKNYPLVFQMANIGAEVGRAINWREKGNTETSKNAFYRTLELIDFTIDDPKNKNSLSEILRMRELLVDYFIGDNIYRSTDDSWNKYFYSFNYAARTPHFT